MVCAIAPAVARARPIVSALLIAANFMSSVPFILLRNDVSGTADRGWYARSLLVRRVPVIVIESQ